MITLYHISEPLDKLPPALLISTVRNPTTDTPTYTSCEVLAQFQKAEFFDLLHPLAILALQGKLDLNSTSNVDGRITPSSDMVEPATEKAAIFMLNNLWSKYVKFANGLVGHYSSEDDKGNEYCRLPISKEITKAMLLATLQGNFIACGLTQSASIDQFYSSPLLRWLS